MVTAAPHEQLKLLAVQVHESRLRHLARLRTEAVADAALKAAVAAVASARSGLADAEAAREAADAAVEELETQGSQVAARIAKDEAQLLAGQAGAGTLQGLQREIESLTQKRSELDDAELEAMDAAEAATAAAGVAAGALAGAESAEAEERARVRALVAELDAEKEAESAARTQAAAGVPADLLAFYEATLQRRGVGAARLFHGVSEGSGLALSPGDLADIKRQAEDAVVLCPDSGVILVRSPEWS